MTIYPQKKLILLAGRAKTGKDYFSTFFEDEFVCSSLADVLKSRYSKKFNVPLQDLYSEETKEIHRQGLIDFSEKVVKPAEGKECWAKGLLNDYNLLRNKKKGLLVRDCRYPEEVIHFLKTWPGPIVTVLLESQYALQNCGFCLDDLPFDCIIQNDRIERDLRPMVDQVKNEFRTYKSPALDLWRIKHGS